MCFQRDVHPSVSNKIYEKQIAGHWVEVLSVHLLSSKINNNIILTVNPYLTNGFSHHNHLNESTFILREVRSDF